MSLALNQLVESKFQRPCPLSDKDRQHCLLPLKTPCVSGLEVDWHCGFSCLLEGVLLDFPSDALTNVENASRFTAFLGTAGGQSACAALALSTVRALLRATFAQTNDLSETVSIVDRLLRDDARLPNSEVALFVMEVDRAKCSMTWVNAGGLPAFLFRKASGDLQRILSDAPCLGVARKIPRRVGSITDLQIGDIVLVASENVMELLAAQGTVSASDRLLSILKNNQHGSDARSIRLDLFKTLKALQPSSAPKVDVALMLIRIADDRKSFSGRSSCCKSQGVITEDFSFKVFVKDT